MSCLYRKLHWVMNGLAFIGIFFVSGQDARCQEDLPKPGTIDHAELAFTVKLIELSESLGVAKAKDELLFWQTVFGFGNGNVAISSIFDIQEGSLVEESDCKILPAPAPLVRVNPSCKLVHVTLKTSSGLLQRQVRVALKVFQGDDLESFVEYECIVESIYDGKGWLPLEKHVRTIPQASRVFKE